MKALKVKNYRSCDHSYRMDAELQDFVCEKCGTTLGLSNRESHECGADCDIHAEVSGIG